MKRTVEELHEGSPVHRPISGREYARWKRFYRRNPFGPARGDMQAGIVVRAIYAANGKRSLPSVTDCIIVSRPIKGSEGRVTREQLRAIALVTGIPFTDGSGNPDR